MLYIKHLPMSFLSCYLALAAAVLQKYKIISRSNRRQSTGDSGIWFVSLQILWNEQFIFFSPLQKSSKGGPGVQSYPNFNPSADVVALDKAITVKGKRNIYLPCYIRTLP